jgi:hypothetical protein
MLGPLSRGIKWMSHAGRVLHVIGLNLLQYLGAVCLGLMFGIWVLTLHLPRVLGIYGIPGAPQNPNEWSSLFIATAFWGGLWALASNQKGSREDIRETTQALLAIDDQKSLPPVGTGTSS